jgi:3-oxoacyl-[acyl-carrier-protein] synthase II
MGIVSPIGNGKDCYIAKASAPTLPASASVTSEVTHEDYDACGLKMAFYRKLDKFSQLQAVSGMEALSDAALTVSDANATDIGIVVGTSDGPLTTVCDFQQDLVRKGNASGSAFKFPNTVYNAAGGYLSICSGIKGYNVTVTNGMQSGLSALAYGYNIIRQGQEEIVLTTGTDENGEIMTSLYGKLGCVSAASHGAYASDSGFVLSDGSTTLVLESGKSVAARGVTPYAKVVGYGMTRADIKFGTVTGAGDAMADAIRLACKEAGVTCEELDAVVGFSNGMKAFDETEIAAYRAAFGDKKLSVLPVHTVKDLVGESRAAAAALSAGHAALMLAGKLPEEQNAYRYEGGKMQACKVSTASYRRILVTSVAAGGSCCAVVLERA